MGDRQGIIIGQQWWMLVHGHYQLSMSYSFIYTMTLCHLASMDHAMSHQQASRDLTMRDGRAMSGPIAQLLWKTQNSFNTAPPPIDKSCSPWLLLVLLNNWLFLLWLNHQHSVPLPSPVHSNFPFGLNHSYGQHPRRRLLIPRNVCVLPTRACKTRKMSLHVLLVATTSCFIICAVIVMATSSNNKRRWSLKVILHVINVHIHTIYTSMHPPFNVYNTRPTHTPFNL